MFGWGRKASVDERAKQIARMLGFIQHGLRTKSYEQFAASFSNPGADPTRWIAIAAKPISPCTSR